MHGWFWFRLTFCRGRALVVRVRLLLPGDFVVTFLRGRALLRGTYSDQKPRLPEKHPSPVCLHNFFGPDYYQASSSDILVRVRGVATTIG